MNAKKCAYPFQAMILALALAALACGLPAVSVPAGAASSGGPLEADLTQTAEPCLEFYHRDGSYIPVDEQPVKSYLVQHGFDVSGVSADGEGEYVGSTCLSTPDRPSIRSTSLAVRMPVDNISDANELGELSGKLLDALDQLPGQYAPNWKEGTTTFIFESGTGKVEVAFNGDYAVENLRKQQHLDGEALWRGLNDQP